METNETSYINTKTTLRFNLGTFECFNSEKPTAAGKILTADEMVSWDHNQNGRAEFRPSGDHVGVALIFGDQSSVTCSEVVALDNLLHEFGDKLESFVRIHDVCQTRCLGVSDLTANDVKNPQCHIFIGGCPNEMSLDAARELFELYYPETYKVWETCNCEALRFDTEFFLENMCRVEEFKLGEQVALLVEVR